MPCVTATRHCHALIPDSHEVGGEGGGSSRLESALTSWYSWGTRARLLRDSRTHSLNRQTDGIAVAVLDDIWKSTEDDTLQVFNQVYMTSFKVTLRESLTFYVWQPSSPSSSHTVAAVRRTRPKFRRRTGQGRAR
ncbi:hypothetical protein PISMIDRAFT_570233 [Pisolithus microcarpus 441]|uniref:Uncharacterized protein n=1 Tax=Pisolithus microcarpus 441 TaxID=765257 RepID=A0A0C9Y858_9AGAM|nr:hypothetical protein PISMIDRAFT_570233 [Pisolithus microcarpus 441]